MPKLIDITGKKFNRLTAVEYKGSEKWLFRCDCGNEKIMSASDVRLGKAKSCGCIHKEMLSKRETTHGMSKTRLYSVWRGMKVRCYNENSEEFHRYGGRGITVCDEWLGKYGFKNFAEWAYKSGYDENAERGQCTIDRIDNDKGYSSDNCRWITIKEQQTNKMEHKWEINGESHTLDEWEKISGLTKETIRQRIRNGWSEDDVLIVPKRGEDGFYTQQSKRIEFNGEKHTISEWSRIIGISEATIRSRIIKGLNTEEILSKEKVIKKDYEITLRKTGTKEEIKFDKRRNAAEYIGVSVYDLNNCICCHKKEINGYEVEYKIK